MGMISSAPDVASTAQPRPAAAGSRDGDPQITRVIRYYRATQKAYARFWAGRRDRAMHFGHHASPGVSHADAVLAMNDVLAGLAGVGADDLVIDAGCGFGGTAVWLAEERGCRAIGVNVTPHHRAIGEEHARARGVADKVSFRMADFADTGLPAGSADVFWALESMVHAKDRQAVLDEAFRLLRPGGRLMVCEYFLRDDPPLDAEEIARLAIALDGWAMPRLLSLAEIGALAGEAGFESGRLTGLRAAVTPSVERMRRLVAFALPPTRWLAKRGWYDPDRVAHSEGCLALADAFARRSWEYCAFVATKPSG